MTTMEILHRGTPPGEKKYEATCNCCKTVVRFAQSEGEVTHSQRDGSFVTVKCPVCHGQIHQEL